MKNELEKVLKPLYEELSQINPAKVYNTFCAQWGRMYQKGGMLFAGRAVNGWKTICRDVELLFKEGDENQIFAREDQMRWVEEHDECSFSAFWRVVRAVSQRILGIGEAGTTTLLTAIFTNLHPNVAIRQNHCAKSRRIYAFEFSEPKLRYCNLRW